MSSSMANLLINTVKMDPKALTDPSNYPVYPGSYKGPHPEDDVEFANNWF